MSLERSPKPQKTQLQIKFECTQNHICFDPSKDNPICAFSPCPLNLDDFGTHQRIIEFYLRLKKWDEAFYYFRNLMNKFPLDCNIDQMNDILEKRLENPNANFDKKALPIGCQLYIEIDELSNLKNDNLYYYESLKEDRISKEGQKKYNSGVKSFKHGLIANLIRLEHLVNSKKEEIRKEKEEREYKIELTKAQMGNLKPKSLELPIQGDVENAITEKTTKPGSSAPKSKPKPKNSKKKKAKDISGI